MAKTSFTTIRVNKDYSITFDSDLSNISIVDRTFGPYHNICKDGDINMSAEAVAGMLEYACYDRKTSVDDVAKVVQAAIEHHKRLAEALRILQALMDIRQKALDSAYESIALQAKEYVEGYKRGQ